MAFQSWRETASLLQLASLSSEFLSANWVVVKIFGFLCALKYVRMTTRPQRSSSCLPLECSNVKKIVEINSPTACKCAICSDIRVVGSRLHVYDIYCGVIITAMICSLLSFHKSGIPAAQGTKQRSNSCINKCENVT